MGPPSSRRIIDSDGRESDHNDDGRHLRADPVVLLAQKNQRIKLLENELKTRTLLASHLQARLFSTLDALDTLQLDHTLELEHEHKQQDALRKRMRGMESLLKDLEQERDELREVLEVVVRKVEMSNDFGLWPQPAMRTSGSSSRPPRPARPRSPPVYDHVHEHDDLLYATAVISELQASLRDSKASLSANHAHIKDLEAKVARREAEVEALIARSSDTRASPVQENDRGRVGKEEAIQILESSARRNRRLSTEVQDLVGRLEEARAEVDRRSHRSRGIQTDLDPATKGSHHPGSSYLLHPPSPPATSYRPSSHPSPHQLSQSQRPVKPGPSIDDLLDPNTSSPSIATLTAQIAALSDQISNLEANRHRLGFPSPTLDSRPPDHQTSPNPETKVERPVTPQARPSHRHQSSHGAVRTEDPNAFSSPSRRPPPEPSAPGTPSPQSNPRTRDAGGSYLRVREPRPSSPLHHTHDGHRDQAVELRQSGAEEALVPSLAGLITQISELGDQMTRLERDGRGLMARFAQSRGGLVQSQRDVGQRQGEIMQPESRVALSDRRNVRPKEAKTEKPVAQAPRAVVSVMSPVVEDSKASEQPRSSTASDPIVVSPTHTEPAPWPADVNRTQLSDFPSDVGHVSLHESVRAFHVSLKRSPGRSRTSGRGDDGLGFNTGSEDEGHNPSRSGSVVARTHSTAEAEWPQDVTRVGDTVSIPDLLSYHVTPPSDPLSLFAQPQPEDQHQPVANTFQAITSEVEGYLSQRQEPDYDSQGEGEAEMELESPIWDTITLPSMTLPVQTGQGEEEQRGMEPADESSIGLRPESYEDGEEYENDDGGGVTLSRERLERLIGRLDDVSDGLRGADDELVRVRNELLELIDRSFESGVGQGSG